MSSTLALAKLLQQKSVAELEAILSLVRSSTNALGDLFDLAKLLLTKRELERRIRALPADELTRLRESVVTEQLQEHLLADTEVFEEASELAKGLQPLRQPSLEDFGGSLGLLETLMALTELLFALEQHWFETTNTGIRASDARLIGDKFHVSAKRIQQQFQLAMTAGLVVEHDGRWALSPAGRQWLSLERESAWEKLAEAVWDLPGGEWQTGDIGAQLAARYPLLDQGSIKLLAFGPHLGLLQGSELRISLRNQRLGEIANQLISQLPRDEDRLIVQSDLSIVCPGPISPSLHSALDSFAISEEIGLASRFRLSQLSISHYLETGGSLAEVEQTLEQYSGKQLPQPVQYLLADAERKFGQLRIHWGRPTVISSTDPILLTQIANERALAPLALQPVAQGLATNAGIELAYFSLRDCSYAAIMVDGPRIISPRAAEVSLESIPPTRQMHSLAQQLHDSEAAGVGEGDVRRVLQFALKNRLEVSVEFEDQSGQIEKVQLIPLGLTDTRMRGRETIREAERTLPIARIKNASLD